MKSDTNDTRPFGYAYSGRIIGEVVDALNLDQGVLKERTAKRFFEGHTVNQHNRSEILNALGQALVERGIVTIPHILSERDISMSEIVAGIIDEASSRWDGLLARIQNRSTPIKDYEQAVDQFLRFVVIDLSLRVFALARLSGIELQPTVETPSWAQENGGGKLLRSLTENAGLTRDRLAAQLGVSETSIDNWLDGKNRPTSDNIRVLADVLANAITNSDARNLEKQIHRQFTLAQIADLLVPFIGRDKVREMGFTLMRFAWLIAEDVKSMERPALEEDPRGELAALCFGTDHFATPVLLENLADSVSDEDWRKDILRASVDWNIQFERVSVQTGGGRTAAGLAQDVTEVFNNRGIDGEIYGYDDPAQEAINQLILETTEATYNDLASGKLTSPVSMLDNVTMGLRAIVRNFPTSAAAHFQLGSHLGMAGKHLLCGDLIDEGIVECKIASGLLPDWDNPAVEPGIILINIGEYEEALQELMRAKEALQEETPHLMVNMGYALMMLSRHQEALAQFEDVIDVKPDYALALNHAARCAFAIGDKRKGIRYAKKARRFGEPAAYKEWRKERRSSGKKRGK